LAIDRVCDDLILAKTRKMINNTNINSIIRFCEQ
jgi:hypothetical protein